MDICILCTVSLQRPSTNASASNRTLFENTLVKEVCDGSTILVSQVLPYMCCCCSGPDGSAKPAHDNLHRLTNECLNSCRLAMHVVTVAHMYYRLSEAWAKTM